MKKLTLITLVLALTFTTPVISQQPLGGQPPPGAKQSVTDLDAQVAYQRAFEATLWAMPAVAIYRFRIGLLSQPGMADNVITAFDGPLHTFHELITPNQVTPYVGAVTDLRKGPVVLEVPAKTDKAVLYGQIVVDAWQSTIADVGPTGADKGAKVQSICCSRPVTADQSPTATSCCGRVVTASFSASAQSS